MNEVAGDPTSARAALNREASSATAVNASLVTTDDTNEAPPVPTPRDVLRSMKPKGGAAE